jgi:hypothetical protein
VATIWSMLVLVDDRLPVDLADRADQALRVPRGIVGAV